MENVWPRSLENVLSVQHAGINMVTLVFPASNPRNIYNHATSGLFSDLGKMDVRDTNLGDFLCVLRSAITWIILYNLAVILCTTSFNI